MGSHFNHKGDDHNGWNLTGGVTILDSSSKFLNCQFMNSFAEDALNIFNSNFELLNCNFAKSYSDSFDSDFSEGRIAFCSFDDIGGDAIDFSGSKCVISDTNCSNVQDKCISVGEKSEIQVFSTFLSNSSFGIVAKDNSHVEADNVITNYIRVAGLAAFQKKNIFGPASIAISNFRTQNTNKTAMSQFKSKITIDSIDVPNESFSSLDLYKQKINE